MTTEPKGLTDAECYHECAAAKRAAGWVSPELPITDFDIAIFRAAFAACRASVPWSQTGANLAADYAAGRKPMPEPRNKDQSGEVESATRKDAVPETVISPSTSPDPVAQPAPDIRNPRQRMNYDQLDFTVTDGAGWETTIPMPKSIGRGSAARAGCICA